MSTPTILFVIAPEQFRDEEFFTPYNTFKAEGWTCTVASPKTGLATGMLGGSFDVTQALDDSLQAADYDALVIVGGSGTPQWLWPNETLHALATAFAHSGKPTTAICLSGVVLANAGLLNGKRATVWPMAESLEAYASAGATYVEEPVVVDGCLITANGPEAADAFTQAIKAALSSAKTATLS